MENQLLIGAIVFITLLGVMLYLLRSKKDELPVYADVLTKEEYKVKGQWDK